MTDKEKLVRIREYIHDQLGIYNTKLNMDFPPSIREENKAKQEAYQNIWDELKCLDIEEDFKNYFIYDRHSLFCNLDNVIAKLKSEKEEYFTRKEY